MTIDMITFIVIKNIHDYHNYSAYKLIAKTIIRIFGHNSKFCCCHRIFDYHNHYGIFFTTIYIYTLVENRKKTTKQCVDILFFKIEFLKNRHGNIYIQKIV